MTREHHGLTWPRAGHGTNGPSVVSHSRQAMQTMARSDGTSYLKPSQRCSGVSSRPEGHGCDNPPGWWQGQHRHTDVRRRAPSELAPSSAGAKPLPKARCWDRLERASPTRWRDERGRSPLMGGSEGVKSCCCFWQSLSLAWPAKLRLSFAASHRLVFLFLPLALGTARHKDLQTWNIH